MFYILVLNYGNLDIFCEKYDLIKNKLYILLEGWKSFYGDWCGDKTRIKAIQVDGIIYKFAFAKDVSLLLKMSETTINHIICKKFSYKFKNISYCEDFGFEIFEEDF